MLGALLVLTIGLGAWSVRAIRSTAARRATLVDQLNETVPAVEGARVVVPWQPVADVDLAHTTLCFDDGDAARALASFGQALEAHGWRVERPPAASTALTANDGSHRLRGTIEPARRIDCDQAQHQILLSVEAAPLQPTR